MKVIFVQNCIFNGMRYAAGDAMEVAESRIKELGTLVKKSSTTPEPKPKQETKTASRTAVKAAPKPSTKTTAKKK